MNKAACTAANSDNSRSSICLMKLASAVLGHPWQWWGDSLESSHQIPPPDPLFAPGS